MRSFSKIIAAIIFLTIWSSNYMAQGCAQCKAQIESSEENGLSVGNGLNSGIMLLMLAPYVIMMIVFRKSIVKFLMEFAGMWKSKKS
jgi:hypothetical protein